MREKQFSERNRIRGEWNLMGYIFIINFNFFIKAKLLYFMIIFKNNNIYQPLAL